MDYRKTIADMTPEIYRSLRRALELGKWPDGAALSPRQREDAMQAVIAWGRQHLPEHEQVGYIDRGRKAGQTCGDAPAAPLNWKRETR